MLPRRHRLTRPPEISAVVSRGTKIVTPLVIVHAFTRSPTSPIAPDIFRAAVIASKHLGVAPVRNRVKRQIRHVLRDLLDGGYVRPGQDWVVRALSPATSATWVQLHETLFEAAQKVRNRE